MRQKLQEYKKAVCGGGENNVTRMSVHVSPARYPHPGRKRKSPKDPHPAGKKKKEKAIQHMTPMYPSSEDCDPVVRKAVEETRAAVEEMMKELNVMVDQTPPPPQFTLTTVYDNAEEFAKAKADSERKVNSIPPPPPPETRPRPPPSSVDTMVCLCHEVRLEARQSQMDGTMSNVPSNRVCCFVAKTKPSTI